MVDDARARTFARLEDRSTVRRRIALIAAAGLVFAGAWVLSSPGESLWGYAFVVVSAGPVLAWWLLSVIRVAVRRARGGPLEVRADLLVGGAIVVVGLASFLGLSLRVRFELSRDALERAAKAASRSEWQDGPGRTGLYSVTSMRPGPGDSVVLVTNECQLGFAECGFAYSPRGAPPEVCSDSDYRVFSHLTGPWYIAVLASSGPCG